MSSFSSIISDAPDFHVKIALNPIHLKVLLVDEYGSLVYVAAFIVLFFSKQEGKKFEFKEPNPFASENEEVAAVAYRYRKWKLDEVNHRCSLTCS